MQNDDKTSARLQQRQKYTELQKQQHQRFAERMARRQPPEAPTANK